MKSNQMSFITETLLFRKVSIVEIAKFTTPLPVQRMFISTTFNPVTTKWKIILLN